MEFIASQILANRVLQLVNYAKICNYKKFFFSLLVLTFGTLVDSLSHGSFLVSSYEFFKINLIDSIGEHYGSQPWHWYLSQGLPAILGVHIVSFTLACINVIRTRRNCPNELALLFCIIFTITIYRYLLPQNALFFKNRINVSF